VLNRIDIAVPQPAKVRYLEADYKVLSPGDHVTCAITGERIPLDELKYWSWERQEAYVDHQAALEAELLARGLK
jgi:hypothetical protein